MSEVCPLSCNILYSSSWQLPTRVVMDSTARPRRLIIHDRPSYPYATLRCGVRFTKVGTVGRSSRTTVTRQITLARASCLIVQTASVVPEDDACMGNPGSACGLFHPANEYLESRRNWLCSA